MTAIATTHWLADLAMPPEETKQPSINPTASVGVAWAALAEAWGISHEALAARVAARYHLPLADLGVIAPSMISLVPERIARRYGVIALHASDRQITVATSDPTDLDLEQALGFATGRKPLLEIAAPSAIAKAIEGLYRPDRLVERLVGKVGTEMADQVVLLEEEAPEAVSTSEIDATPVVRLTNLILHEAVRARASDIHLEPGHDGGTVRFRVDGVMRVAMKVPSSVLSRVIPRIKIMGKLDIADRLRPQDGRARLKIEDTTLDLRISTVPTRDAEKAVIRLLDPRNAKHLEALEIMPPELARIRRLFGYREGIVVVTGPTGSGKTTLLYAALREIATGDVNIMSVEDPIEYELPGLTQIQVETKRDLTFATALRSILRQDPDVIFVGEIRDRDTAEMAVQASLTGHLVLTTLHANDAVGAVARLRDLGVEQSKIAATLRGSVAQRLARRACPDCSTPIDGDLTPEEARLAHRYGVQPRVRVHGCPACSNSGYRGRVPLLEVLMSNPEFEALVATGGTPAELHRAAMGAGFRSLRENAIERVRRGETTLQEISRVLGDAKDDAEEPVAEVSRILLVDDDVVTRTMARVVLENNGFAVDEAANGAAALAMLNSGKDHALMVLDLDMPVMGGREVLRTVRKAIATAGLPVLVLTGAVSDDVEVELMDEGADDYIRKPLEPGRFVARVRAALRRAGG
jgi:type II secretory ATPase GspE/PulE/Tfp pilus assembly ATPase PilB-like protein/ActR/RegA family two-component response regulator